MKLEQTFSLIVIKRLLIFLKQIVCQSSLLKANYVATDSGKLVFLLLPSLVAVGNIEATVTILYCFASIN